MSEQKKYAIQSYQILKPNTLISFQLINDLPINAEVVLKKQKGVRTEDRRLFSTAEESLIKTIGQLGQYRQDFPIVNDQIQLGFLAALWETKAISNPVDTRDLGLLHGWLCTLGEYGLVHSVFDAMKNIRIQGIDAGSN